MSGQGGAMRAMTRADRMPCFTMRQTVHENRRDISFADYAAASDLYIDRGDCAVWDDHGRILGEATVDRETGVVEGLYVDAAAQGRGIGSALLDRCCDTLFRLGHHEARLSTMTGTRAEAFYLKRGFVTHKMEGSDTAFMRRSLD